MTTQESITLLNGYVTERRRTTANGAVKSRFTFEVKSEPITHNLDESALGLFPALAIREVLVEQIRSITATISKEASLARKYVLTAFEKSKPWAVKRYSGGKTGVTPPTTSQRKFNNSGRLANKLFVRHNAVEGTFTVNVPANRLSNGTFPTSALTEMLAELLSLVPAFANPASLVADERVQLAIAKAYQEILIQKRTRDQNGNLQLLKAGLDFARQLGELGSALSGEE